ncbi:MAG TPA: T9SS type A sorting domain-containing protein [Paludibacter sp.]|nr:T9SS type A sorting domain-containing protein [Paludibacter sp.]
MKLKNLLQRKVYILFFISLLTSFATNAQTWDSPVPVGSSLTNNGQYYVYSVGAKAFLVRNGDWGTQASVAATGALITAVQNGSYWVLQFEGSTRTLFRSAADANGWVYTDNSTENTWDIQVTDATSNIYSIQCPSSYAAYNATQFLGTSSTAYSSGFGSVYDVRYNRTASDHTKWLFVAAADVAKYNAKVALDRYMSIAKNVGSSVDLTPYISAYNTGTTADITTAVTDLKAALTVTDKTSSITNPTFATTPTTGWTVANYGWTDGVLEFYKRNGNTLTQTITGLQAGVYMVKYQGFQRPYATASADRVLYNNGQDMRPGKVSVVAGGVTTSKLLPSLFSETTCPSGVTVDGFKFPGSKADAKAAFDLGLYDNEIGAVTVDATGSLTITTTVYYRAGNFGEWNVVDNFRLYYYGASVAPAIGLSANSLYFDSNNLTKTFTVTGENLTENVVLSAPAGITLDKTTLTPAEAAAGATVTATFGDAANIVDGTISVASGSLTRSISISASADAACFTPLYSGRTNLIKDPYCSDFSNFGGWGNNTRAINSNIAYSYCGLRSLYLNGSGSIDASVAGGIAVASNKTYRAKAMIYAPTGNVAKFGLFNIGYGTSGIDVISTTTNNVWVTADFTFKTATVTDGGIYFQRVSGTGNVYVDNYELYEVTEPTIRIKYVDAADVNTSLQADRVYASTWGTTVANYLTIGKTYTALASDKASISYNGQTYTYDATSVDSVTIDEGEKLITLKFNVDVPTAVDGAKSSALSVYPTISNGSVNVLNGASGAIKVYDVAGRIVLNKVASSAREAVALPSAGVFFLEVSNGGVTKKFKVVNVK